MPIETTSTYHPLEIQPKIGLYDIGHNIVEWVDDVKVQIILEKTGNTNEAIELGRSLGAELRSRGVSEIASNWREELEEWNKQ